MSDEKLNLELNKFSLSQVEHDADLRHKWEQESYWRFQESHWKFQRWFWVGTVILLALGIILNSLIGAKEFGVVADNLIS